MLIWLNNNVLDIWIEREGEQRRRRRLEEKVRCIYIYPEELDGEPWGNITALYSLLSQGGRSFNVFSERMSFLLLFFASTHSSYLYHEYNKDERYVYANNHSRDLGTKIRKIIQKKFSFFYSSKIFRSPHLPFINFNKNRNYSWNSLIF